jgi:hypothetical protein
MEKCPNCEAADAVIKQAVECLMEHGVCFCGLERIMKYMEFKNAPEQEEVGH